MMINFDVNDYVLDSVDVVGGSSDEEEEFGSEDELMVDDDIESKQEVGKQEVEVEDSDNKHDPPMLEDADADADATVPFPDGPDNETFDEWRQRLQSAVPGQLMTLVISIYDEFGGADRFQIRPHEDEGALLQRILTEVYSNKFPGPINLGVDLISAKTRLYNAKALSLYINLRRQDLDATTRTKYIEMLDVVFIRVKLLQTIREATFQYQLTFQPAYCSIWTVEQGIQQIQQNNGDEIPPLRRAILFCVFEADKLNLRHSGDRVMIPVFKDGKMIRAFKHYMSMREFVNGLQRNVYSAAHSILTALSNLVKLVSENLSENSYDIFPEYKPNREWMAFKNGMYHLEEDKFYDHDDPHIPKDLTASVYHDVELPWVYLKSYSGKWDDPKWVGIECVLHKIVHTQYPPGKSRRAVCMRLRSRVSNPTEMSSFPRVRNSSILCVRKITTRRIKSPGFMLITHSLNVPSVLSDSLATRYLIDVTCTLSSKSFNTTPVIILMTIAPNAWFFVSRTCCIPRTCFMRGTQSCKK